MQVRASHILVESQQQAVELRNRITSGFSTFIELAQQYSKCPSGQKGGDLGDFGPGAMVPAFEKAAFETPVGKVSEPVQTQFGWHIIQRTA
jgi:peptidyl-prolyl cis-trans isomerase C